MVGDGDLNHDGEVNVGDLVLLYQYVLGTRTITPDALSHGDMNLDGQLNIADVLLLQKQLLTSWLDWGQTEDTILVWLIPTSQAALPPNTGVLYYVHNDSLGTPLVMTDEAGGVVWKAEYDPFGQAAINEDPDNDGNNITLNMRFPGQYYDQETGLHYNYKRYYDASLGRYITADPILEIMLVDRIVTKGNVSRPTLMQIPIDKNVPQNWQAYGYVFQNPIRFRDPLGLEVSPGCQNPPGSPCDLDVPPDPIYASQGCCIERCWSYWKCDQWWHYIGILTPAFCLGNGLGCILSCTADSSSY